MGAPLDSIPGCIEDNTEGTSIYQGVHSGTWEMRIKDDRNDSSTKEVLSAFPKDNISQDIKEAVQDVVHLRHLGPRPGLH